MNLASGKTKKHPNDVFGASGPVEIRMLKKIVVVDRMREIDQGFVFRPDIEALFILFCFYLFVNLHLFIYPPIFHK